MNAVDSNSALTKTALLFASALTVMAAATIAPSLPAAFRGRAIGGFSAFVFMGQFLSAIVSQPLTEQFGLDQTYFIGGCFAVFLALLILAAKNSISVFIAPEPERAG